MEISLAYQLKWAGRFARPYWRQLLVHLVLELLVVCLGLLFIWWSKRAIDYAVSEDLAAMRRALFLLILSAVSGVGLNLWSSWLNERTRALMLINLQQEVVHTQMQATWHLIKDWHTGDIMVRVNSDCQEVVQVIGKAFISAVTTTLRLVAAVGFLWWMDPILAVFLLVISPLVVCAKFYFRKLRKLSLELKRAESKLANVVQENLRFRLPIRALNLDARRWRKIEESQERIYAMKMRVLNFSTYSKSMMNVIGNTGFLVVFACGVYKLYFDEITFGTLSAFLQLVSRIQGPISVLMGLTPLFIRFRASLERLDEMLLTEKEEDIEAEHFSQVQQITLSGLGFRYEDKDVIQDLHACFVRGEPTAIIGASGKGKTTLIRLLLALFAPMKGQIYLEVDGKKVALARQHRTNFTYVPQGDKLFSGTIRENLQVTDTALSALQLREALAAACASFVFDLPQGLDTLIGESGHGLSEGQLQRIAVARALLRDCSIWLFDEVTSALDPPTAAELTKALLEAGKDKILIFVTHDRKLAEACSQTIYI
jgi:ATP-binding cassette, subfamily B, bacterial